MRLASAIVFSLTAVLGACGYRPVAGRLALDVPKSVRFAPFLVANDTAELALTHVVSESARGELARRGLLADAPDADGALQLHLRLVRVADVPASYAPNGSVIEYFGELYMEYQVYSPAATAPVIPMRTHRVAYRYDFRENPQNVRLYRQAAMARGVREWVPQLTAETALALRFPRPATQAAPRPVTRPTEVFP